MRAPTRRDRQRVYSCDPADSGPTWSLRGTYSGKPVAIDIRLYPVQLKHSMIAAVGDHADQFGVETINDGLRIRKATVDGEVQRSNKQRRQYRTPAVIDLRGMVFHEILHNKLVHQCVVRGIVEKFLKTIFLA